MNSGIERFRLCIATTDGNFTIIAPAPVFVSQEKRARDYSRKNRAQNLCDTAVRSLRNLLRFARPLSVGVVTRERIALIEIENRGACRLLIGPLRTNELRHHPVYSATYMYATHTSDERQQLNGMIGGQRQRTE